MTKSVAKLATEALLSNTDDLDEEYRRKIKREIVFNYFNEHDPELCIPDNLLNIEQLAKFTMLSTEEVELIRKGYLEQNIWIVYKELPNDSTRRYPLLTRRTKKQALDAIYENLEGKYFLFHMPIDEDFDYGNLYQEVIIIEESEGEND
jgi:hypothetical protein